MIINIIEARVGVGLVTTNILAWVYWLDTEDELHKPLRKKEGDIEKGGYVCI